MGNTAPQTKRKYTERTEMLVLSGLHAAKGLSQLLSILLLISEDYEVTFCTLSNCLDFLTWQIEEYCARESGTISVREKKQLEMFLINFEGGLKIAENYLKKAEEALELLKSDVTEYLIEQGILAVVTTAVVTGAGAVVGAGAGKHIIPFGRKRPLKKFTTDLSETLPVKVGHCPDIAG